MLRYKGRGAVAPAEVVEGEVGQPVPFEGVAELLVPVRLRLSQPGGTSTTSLTEYSRLEGQRILRYGHELNGVRTQYVPGVSDERFQLGRGPRTYEAAYALRTGSTTVERRLRVRLDDRAPVTVPAGTFDSCLFEVETNGERSRVWVAVGVGVMLKTETQSGTQELEAGSQLNGVDIR